MFFQEVRYLDRYLLAVFLQCERPAVEVIDLNGFQVFSETVFNAVYLEKRIAFAPYN